MRRFFGFVIHLVGAMLKGFFFTGMAPVLTEPNHQVRVDTSLALA